MNKTSHFDRALDQLYQERDHVTVQISLAAHADAPSAQTLGALRRQLAAIDHKDRRAQGDPRLSRCLRCLPPAFRLVRQIEGANRFPGPRHLGLPAITLHLLEDAPGLRVALDFLDEALLLTLIKRANTAKHQRGNSRKIVGRRLVDEAA